jgi:hypothetical protein
MRFSSKTLGGELVMASVYDEDAFQLRVNYAAQCFVRGISGTRHFDTCFEMCDGDLVVTALVRRAMKNPRLYDAIADDYREGFPKGWLNTAEQWKDVPTRKLAAIAKLEREKTKQRWAAKFEETTESEQRA